MYTESLDKLLINYPFACRIQKCAVRQLHSSPIPPIKSFACPCELSCLPLTISFLQSPLCLLYPSFPLSFSSPSPSLPLSLSSPLPLSLSPSLPLSLSSPLPLFPSPSLPSPSLPLSLSSLSLSSPLPLLPSSPLLSLSQLVQYIAWSIASIGINIVIVLVYQNVGLLAGVSVR